MSLEYDKAQNKITSQQKAYFISVLKSMYSSVDELDFDHAEAFESTPNNYFGKGVTRVEVPFLKNKPTPRDGPSLKCHVIKENGVWRLDSDVSM